MKLLLVLAAVAISQKWLEYRFSRDYGNYFFDYSLNGRYGTNGDTKYNTFVISTDRGIYLNYDLISVTINSKGVRVLGC